MRSAEATRWMLALALGLAVYVAGCRRATPKYSQETPQAVIASAQAMVREGNARELARLVFADSVELRAVLNRLGECLGSLQRLADAVARRMPEEVSRLRAANADPKAAAASGLLGALSGNRAGGAAKGERGGPDGQPAAVRGVIETVLVDPFAWIERNASRVATVAMADDLVAIQIDGQPVLPPLGLTMRRSGDEWFVVLPLNLPLVDRYLPQTRQEWSIVASLVRVVDGVVKELADEVESGRLKTIDALAQRAGEKAFGPAAMVFLVYQKEITVRQRRQPMLADIEKRLSAWSEERAEGGAAPELIARAAALIRQASVEPIDRLAREELGKNPQSLFPMARRDGAAAATPAGAAATATKPRYAKMSRGEFEADAEDWLKLAGVPLDLDAPLDEAAVAAAEAAWQARRAGRDGAKPGRAAGG